MENDQPMMANATLHFLEKRFYGRPIWVSNNFYMVLCYLQIKRNDESILKTISMFRGI